MQRPKRRCLRVHRHTDRYRALKLESLEQRILLVSDWQNPLFNLDVDDDGVIAPADALLLINDINKFGSRQITTPLDDNSLSALYLDTSGDGYFAPIDVLLVINSLNSGLVPPSIDLQLSTDTGISPTDRITSVPIVQGHAESSSVSTLESAKIRVNRDAVIALPIDPAGNFSFDPRSLPGFSDGFTTIGVAVTSATGAVGLRKFSFNYDNTSPTLGTPRLAAADDTGVSDSDNVTRIANPHLQVHAEVGVQLVVQVGSQQFSETVSGDLWENQLVVLADGSYQVMSVATDLAGNIAQTSAEITIDTTPPPAATFDLSPTSDTGPKGDQQTGATRVTLIGNTEGNSFVTLDSVAQGVRSAGDGKFHVPGVVLTSGPNSLMAQVVDLAGNVGPDSQVTLTRIVEAGVTDPVVRWNDAALEAIRLDATNPPVATRNLVMVSLAMYDVVSAVEGTPSFAVKLLPPADVSAEAAASSAAFEVLKYAYPAQENSLQAVLNSALAEIPDGQAKTDGVSFGRLVAEAVIALRSSDGWNTFAIYTPRGNTPGNWQPTAPQYAPALLPQWDKLRTFAIASAEALVPTGPPNLTSSTYGRDLQEVASLGRATGSSRTTDQTQAARFWADGPGTLTPPGHWNAIAGQVAQSAGNSWGENARLFAELNAALGDAAIVVWSAKYAYEFWRPITAIQQADLDGNALITADPAWSPLLITPPFPEYVSGHSTFSAAAARILTHEFGSAVAFTTASPDLPGVERSFASFEQAAEEAGRSRVYGGIHFEFANQDGQTAGRAVADEVLDRFSVADDLLPPQIVFTSPTSPLAGLVTNTSPTIQGWVIDNLSGVRSLQAAVDGQEYAAVSFDSAGRFSFQPQSGLPGSSDGVHIVNFRATDHAGLTSPISSFAFTLDSEPPTIEITGLTDGAEIRAGQILAGIANGTGSLITSLSYQIGTGSIRPLSFDASSGIGRFSQPLDLFDVAPGTHTITVMARDAAGLTTVDSVSVQLVAAIPIVVTSMGPAAGAIDVGTTVRPQVFFSRAVEASSLTAANFYAAGPDGAKLPATIVPATDGSFAWLFFNDPMPGGSLITLHVDGATIVAAADGLPLDADRDAVAGGLLETTFRTVSLAPLLGTSLSGRVVDPGPDLSPMTFDDIRAGADQALHTADDVFLAPLAGVRVFILGMEDQAVLTDAEGHFHFDAVPAGNVKLAIDGRTATNAPAGFYFPEMVMDLNLRAGQANTAMGTMGTLAQQQANADRGEVYLPRLRTDIFQDLSTTEATVITLDPESSLGLTPEQRARLTLTVEPGTLIGHDGQPITGGQIGISTVPPELVREMLPPGLLQHTFDITIQAPGIDRFTAPVPMTFPNLMGAAPGSQLNFLSFDHATGRLVIEGTATVSADGLTASTDPGTGITHPGWHGLTPLGTPTDPSCPPLKPGSFSPIDVTPIPVTIGLHDYFFKDDKGQFTLSVGNAAQPLFPDSDPCDPFNALATPMIVKIDLEGPANVILEGLATQEFSLLPGQQKNIKVQVADLLDRIRGVNFDRFFGVSARIQAWQAGKPGDLRLDKKLYVSRFVDAADSIHDDGVIEFIDTLNDGAANVTRKRKLEFFGPRPDLQVADVNFGLTGTPDVTEGVFFDPETTGKDITTLLLVRNPEGADIPGGTLLLKGEGSPRNRININKFALDNVLAALAAGTTPPGVVDYVLLTATERALFDEAPERAAIIDAIVAKVSALFADVSPGIAVEDAVLGDDVVLVRWMNVAPIGSFGQSVPGGTDDQQVDKHSEIVSVETNRNRWNLSERAFHLANAVNQVTAGFVDVYVDNHLEWPTAADGGIPNAQRQPLNLTSEQLVNALAYNVAHEVGHTLGLIHSAQGAPSDINTGEQQRINLSGGTSTSTFTLTFEGQTTAALQRNANATVVETALQNLSSLAGLTSNVGVTGSPGGPYIVTFHGLLSGTDVPLLTGSGSDGLAPLIITIVEASSVAQFQDDGGTPPKPLHVKIGSVLGRNDVMYGGNLDLDGNSTFQSKMTLELLRMALKVDFTLADALRAFDYLVARFGVGTFSGLGESDGGEISRPQGPFLAVRADDDQLIFDQIEFGTVAVDGGAGAAFTLPVKLLNYGSENLALHSVRVVDSLGQFLANVDVLETVLGPGEELVLSLTFDPLVSGDGAATLVIDSNDVTAQAEIALAGFGLAPDGDIRIDVANNNLGGRKIAASPVMRDDVIELQNIGASPLTITEVRFAAGNEFAVGGLPVGFGPGQPLVIGPGGSFVLDVSFDPGATGLRRAALEIVSDDPETPVVRQTVVGTGLADVGNALDYGNDFVALETHQLAGAPAFRQRSDDGGNWSFFLPANEAIHHSIFDPVSGLIADAYDVTAQSGQTTSLLTPIFLASTAHDTDGDGLPDDIEFAVGTGLNDTDTDSDGLSDFVEIVHGLDPLGGLGLPTGVVAAATLRGEAHELVLEGSLTDSNAQTAYVATGNYGLAILDVTLPTTPIILSELNLAGVSTDVAVDAARNLAVLAAGSAGIHIVDISNPALPTVVTTVQVAGGASRVEVFGGLAYVAAGNSVVSVDLATHLVRQTLEVGQQFLRDLAVEGNTLYTLDAGTTLRAITLDSLEMVLRGSVSLPGAAGQLFVGNGIAYAPVSNSDLTGFVFGFVTADVRDPANLTLISGSDLLPSVPAPGMDFAATGSGLGLLIGDAPFNLPLTGRFNSLDVMVVADPANTGSFVTRILLPSMPRGIGIASGLSFIADDASGLQVVSFQPLDTLGQVPAITIAAAGNDRDPVAPGIQVRGGASIQVQADVLDDVLVRNVELLVNGQVVRNDVSFPWDLVATAPVDNEPIILVIQARATDTGGNTGLSNLLTIEVLPDDVAPALIATSPGEGQQVPRVEAIDLVFDEELDGDLLDVAGVTLTNLGGDGLPGGGDDTAVPIGELVLGVQGRILTIVPADELAAGVHRLTVDAAVLADAVGNHVLTSVELSFMIPSGNALIAASGLPADPELPSANVRQEISFVMPWGPEAARISYPAIRLDGSQFIERLNPSRTDPVTRTAFFMVPDNAITGDITVFGGGTLEISDLPNWTVVDGSVDLFGEDVTGNSNTNDLPGNGLYLDLGSSNTNSSPLESKTLFDLTPGDYELRFDLAGQSNVGTQTVTVSLGDDFRETFTRPARSPFATFTRTITVTDPAAARLVFDHDLATTRGLHLDNVKLTRVDSGAVLLDDHFDLPFPFGTFPLQIVPVLTGVDITSVPSNGSSAAATLDGTGFIEGENTIYQFGSVSVLDSEVSAGPDVVAFDGANSRATLTLPLSQAAFGAISVTTAGGRSEFLTLGVSAIVAMAFSGTPADPAVPSANPGQSITIIGAGLKATTDIIVQYADESGTLKALLVNPTLADFDGTSAQVILPDVVSGVIQVSVFGTQTALPLQIVPVVQQGKVIIPPLPAGPFTRLTGRGFVEGDTGYDIDGTVFFDAGVEDPAIDVKGLNASVELNFAIGADALVQVTTPGGTSAAVPVNVAAPPDLLAPTITGVVAVAADGVPANSTAGSANTGQIIIVQGANFRLDALQVLFPTRNENGVDGVLGVAPLAVNDAGTLAQVRVPNLAATASLRVTSVGNRNLGFGSANDAIHRNITLTFTPAGSTVELRFADGGLQALSDEGWGLDNVQVTRDAAAIFSDDFEGADRPEWSHSTTADTPQFSRFSGPFSTSVQMLTLTGLTAGTPHTLRFDLYVLDSWDGLDANAGPDRFIVRGDAETLFDEAFSNDPGKTQTFAGPGSVPLQIVPTITGTTHHEGFGYDQGLNILGSGFSEGAGTITIGGLAIQDHFRGGILLDPNVVPGSDNKDYELFRNTPFTLEGPIRVTTAGGYFEIAGPTFRRAAPNRITSIHATAAQGIPLDPNLPSANTGQEITLSGSFDAALNDTLVQFDAVDDASRAGTITRHGQPLDRHKRLLEVTVPESARTGMVRILGSPGELFLQIVPTLRGVGPVIAGAETVLEGTGLFPGDLTLSVDGQPVTNYTVQTVRSRDDFHAHPDRQFVTFTVPTGIGPGNIRAVTSGGTAMLQGGVAQTATQVTPAADAGETLDAAISVTTVMNGRSTIDSDLEARPDPGGDIDLYQVNFQAGERIVIDFAASLSDGESDSAFVRLFNSAGQQLNFDYEPPETAQGRLEFTAPFTGSYYLGVSDIYHADYNPVTGEQFPFEGPDEGYPTGPYQIFIRRLAGDATVLTGITATASSGAPAHAALASANTGQVITLTGSGLRIGEQVIFTGEVGDIFPADRDDLPLAVAGDGSSLTVRVPHNAVSGVVRLSAEAVGIYLQIVPTLDELEVRGTLTPGERTVEVTGSGLDIPATMQFGSVGFLVQSDFNNTFGLVHNGVPLGPISVTTPGGTSAPLAGPDLVSIVALANSGVPANPTLPSANPGQTIRLEGSGFTAFQQFVSQATPLVFQTINAAGIRGERIVDPTTVDPAGAFMTVVVPADAITGPVGVVGDPQGTSIVLQIVPVVTSVVPTTPGVVQVIGKGLIEGDALYRFGANEVLDGSISTAGVDVIGANDQADVALAALGSGMLTVTTSGGTSAPLSFGALMAAASAPANNAAAANLTTDVLQTFVAEAAARFVAAGVTPEQLSGAQAVAWQVSDLPGNYLGLFTNNTILIDRNAAGWGWFIDSTPADDSEFTTPGNQGEQNRMDLLTVVLHELGHLLGHDHDSGGLMAELLAAGVRETDLQNDHVALTDEAFGQPDADLPDAWLAI